MNAKILALAFAALALPAPAAALVVEPGDLFIVVHLGIGTGQVYHVDPETAAETLVAQEGHLTPVLSRRALAVSADGFVYVLQNRDAGATPGSAKLARIDATVDYDPDDPFANQVLVRQGVLLDDAVDVGVVPLPGSAQAAVPGAPLAWVAALLIIGLARWWLGRGRAPSGLKQLTAPPREPRGNGAAFID